MTVRIKTQWRIRHLMTLVAYVALGLAAWRETAPWRRENGQGTMASFLLVSTLLVFFSAFVLRPGPHRDWMVAFFLSLILMPICLLWILAPLVFAAQTVREPNRLLGFLIASPVLILCPVLGLAGMAELCVLLMPERCPKCGRKRLVDSFQRFIQNRIGHAYFQCGTCDALHLLKLPAHACPNCRRHTLMFRRYRFAWCAACGGRYKRRIHRQWEDASDANDDPFYWRWRPGKPWAIETRHEQR